ncbi:hypothetical protein J2X90_005696 [Variovorax paradoxus]|uniref:hypothetical protein n=1 Tax=Variovorax paradoxus TaxID=34073 RepID=UPI00277D949E|nr:hypothetical protein [Variovorax paradoxus]MDQ0027860.1 hypothetical protein [Variovorax paradoxus]
MAGMPRNLDRQAVRDLIKRQNVEFMAHAKAKGDIAALINKRLEYIYALVTELPTREQTAFIELYDEELKAFYEQQTRAHDEQMEAYDEQEKLCRKRAARAQEHLHLQVWAYNEQERLGRKRAARAQEHLHRELAKAKRSQPIACNDPIVQPTDHASVICPMEGMTKNPEPQAVRALVERQSAELDANRDTNGDVVEMINNQLDDVRAFAKGLPPKTRAAFRRLYHKEHQALYEEQTRRLDEEIAGVAAQIQGFHDEQFLPSTSNGTTISEIPPLVTSSSNRGFGEEAAHGGGVSTPESRQDWTEAITGCPKCDHHEWKMASVVYAEGTQMINTRSLGVGVGIGTGGIGVGVGSGSTVGYQQSVFAQCAAPPPPTTGLDPFKMLLPSIICSLFGLGLLVGGISEFDFKALLIGLALFVVPALNVLLFRAEARALEIHAEELDRWRAQKICMRCGQLYS